MPLDSAGFAQKTNVSRETLADYIRWEALLQRWNARINLVAKGELASFWTRHALDSWQICPYLPKKDAHIVDFGSGAGFPGIAAAICCKQSGVGQVMLIESAGKKASFLKTVIRELALPAQVRAERIEKLPSLRAGVITARAFAPLGRLLDYATPHIEADTQFILLKGERVDEELEKASLKWTFTSKTVKSLSDDVGVILILQDVSPITT